MAIAFNMAGGRLSEIFVSEVIFAFGQAATAPYTTPTTEDVSATLSSYFECYDAIMMERHGTVTLGQSLDQAFIRLDALEHTAHICAMAKMMGGARTLPSDEVDHLYEVAHGDAQPPYRQSNNPCPPLEPGTSEPVATLDERIVSAVLESLRRGTG